MCFDGREPEAEPLARSERFLRWIIAPGFTGFSRAAHAFWCVGFILSFAVLPLLGWFGYYCWIRDLGGAMLVGYAAVVSSMLSNATLVVASKMMTTEAIDARAEGRDLEF